MNNWLPIETAPKDGTPILVFEPDIGGPIIAVAEYGDLTWLNPLTGWRDVANVTHWMPLPNPPA